MNKFFELMKGMGINNPKAADAENKVLEYVSNLSLDGMVDVVRKHLCDEYCYPIDVLDESKPEDWLALKERFVSACIDEIKGNGLVLFNIIRNKDTIVRGVGEDLCKQVDRMDKNFLEIIYFNHCLGIYRWEVLRYFKMSDELVMLRIIDVKTYEELFAMICDYIGMKLRKEELLNIKLQALEYGYGKLSKQYDYLELEKIF